MAEIGPIIAPTPQQQPTPMDLAAALKALLSAQQQQQSEQAPSPMGLRRLLMGRGEDPFAP